MAANVLIMVHGMTVDTTPLTHQAEYELMLTALIQKSPVLASAFALKIYVEWGHRPPNVPTADLRPDQRIMDAENSVHNFSGYEAVRADHSALNHTLSPWSHPLAEIESKITSPIKEQVAMFGMTDVFYYIAPDGEQEIRATVYNQILSKLDGLKDQEKVCLHLYAHSLGITVSHDFLYGLFAPDIIPGYYEQAATEKDREDFAYWRSRAQAGTISVGSISSAASQLPLMVMRKQAMVDQLASGQPLDPSVIGLRSDRVHWRLFYDLIDILSFPSRRLYGSSAGIEEFEVDNGSNPVNVHSLYSSNTTVIAKTAELFSTNLE